MEDNSEDVKIGKAIHELKQLQSKNTEISIENIKIDKISGDYLTEIKKSDADVNASTWQVLLYLKILNDKGINKKGKLEFIEKNKRKNTVYVELDDSKAMELEQVIKEIDLLLEQSEVPAAIQMPKCKKCAYYEYCFI
jgi:CRISPR-associated exonuclease Cas4